MIRLPLFQFPDIFLGESSPLKDQAGHVAAVGHDLAVRTNRLPALGAIEGAGGVGGSVEFLAVWGGAVAEGGFLNCGGEGEFNEFVICQCVKNGSEILEWDF